MWVLMIVASIGFKTINGWQILVARMQDNYNKTSICNEHMAAPLSCNRVICCSEVMFEYLQMEGNNPSVQDLEKREDDSYSGWRRADIYGMELMGGGMISCLCFFGLGASVMMSGWDFNSPEQKAAFTTGRGIGDILLTAPVIWVIGKSFKQKGSLWKSMVGAGICSVISTSLLLYTLDHPIKNDLISVISASILLVLPSTGGTIGYNL